MAPELHAKNEEGYDGVKVDIFALGQILYVMKAGKFAFQSSKSNDQYYRILQASPATFAVSQSLTNEGIFIDLVQSMTHKDPKQRLTIKQIRDNMWM